MHHYGSYPRESQGISIWSALELSTSIDPTRRGYQNKREGVLTEPYDS